MNFKNKRAHVLICALLAAIFVLSSFAVYAAGEEESGNVIPKDGENISGFDIDNPTEAPTIEPTDAPTEAPAKSDGENDPKQQEVVENPEDSLIYGDVDGSGVVDINDVSYIQLALAGKKPKTDTYKKMGDTNSDGRITIYDATVVQMYLAGYYKMLPVTADGYYAHIYRP